MRRINKVRPTEAMLVDVLAKSMPGNVYNLAAGDPNLPVCPALQKAYAEAKAPDTHNYGSSVGLPSLREKLWKNPGEVILANGAKQLIYMALAAVTHPGDRVVIIGPCWGSYMRICELLGIEYTLLIGEARERYIPSPEKVAAAITPQTAAVLLNHPNNPTGVVYPDEWIASLLAAVRGADAWLVCDEIYRYLSSVPFRSLRGEENVITIDGFSKALNITGWRLGYAVACEEIISIMTGIQSQMSGPPSTLIQKIVDAAFPSLEFASFENYRERLDLLCRLPKFREARPDAGFYFYLPIAGNWASSRELCESLLREHAVAITPGEDYGVPRTVRISVASEPVNRLEEISDALSII